MNDNVTLRVNGREWNGWTSVRIGAGIERLARDFSVEITRQWPGDEGITTLQPRIKNGSKVEVLIGDELVITGWVEATPVRYDARSVSTGIAGRSLTADLIDCATEMSFLAVHALSLASCKVISGYFPTVRIFSLPSIL